MKNFASVAIPFVIVLASSTPVFAEVTPAKPPDSQATFVSNFGRMFPNLPGFVTPTNQQIADLAQTQLDPNVTPGPKDNLEIPSGDTYLGQFIDHDLTLDMSPSPTSPVDPTTLQSGRSFLFDLDSVYCGGPAAFPSIYAADQKHFLIQEPNPNGVRDLPRNANGSAILCEGRNDENEIISQMHVAFLKFHNRLIDDGYSFNDAKRTMTLYYQWIVLHEFLPAIVGQQTVDSYLKGGVPRVYKPGNLLRPTVPVEFSVAAYRFGHSIVRKAYFMSDAVGKIEVFNPATDDLHGGRQIPVGRQIEWKYFFHSLNEVPNDPDNNHSRNIDPLLSAGLFNLPIPGAEATGSNVLAYRNMVRAKFYNMPSGQSVAAAYGLPVISPAELNLGPGFETGTPLWYYILAESDRVANGKKIGPVGSRIIADVFVSLLEVDKDSILRVEKKFVPAAGQFGMADFLRAAGVADDDE